ncbi:MAG: CTP synthase [Lachnospiraceae bacterium]|nr:CTP synthase [Lachnospiraceae bacterium]
MSKFIFVTGGVVSGLGKGITAASLGRLLKMRGIRVVSQKLDPYMNVDPGTMSPFQHGEVFVTDDGAETDLDLGHYERFTDENMTKYSNLTSGKVYWNVLNRERKGEYLGETVQVIPHITDEIKQFIYQGAKNSDADVLIAEIGGTIGDIEGQPFIEAIRQISLEQGKENCLFIHVTLVPYLSGSNEHKSKPTQHSVKELQALGIHPDIIVTRVDHPLEKSIKDKIALFCNVKKDCVIENDTMDCLYEAPLMLNRHGLDKVVCRELSLQGELSGLSEWQEMVDRIQNLSGHIKIAIVGKYVGLHDSYLSVREALYHGGYENDTEVEVLWIDSEKLTGENIATELRQAQGILVPGGFGDRGTEGMILACRYAREHDIPYLGICLGMQISVIEYARNVLGIEDANSREFDEVGKNCVIDLMEEQMAVLRKGGTMRLGSYPCKIFKGTVLERAYGNNEISERHRHRFEYNNLYRERFTASGLIVCGTSPDEMLVEAVEAKDNLFHVGVQFHPEFKSRPDKAHPLFRELVKAAVIRSRETKKYK